MNWLKGKALDKRAIVDMDDGEYEKLKRNLSKLYKSWSAIFADDDREAYLKIYERKIGVVRTGKIQYILIYMGAGSEAIFRCKMKDKL